MTVFGAIWLVISIVLFFGRIERLAVLLIISPLFECATVLSLSELSLGTLDIVGVLFVVKYFIHGSRGHIVLDARHGFLLAFLAYALIGGLISHALFDGYEIVSYDATPSGDWFAAIGTERLQLSFGFLTAMSRLAIYAIAFLCLLAFSQDCTDEGRRSLFRKSLIASLAIVLPIGAFQFASTLGLFDGSWLMENFHTQDLSQNSAYWNNFNALYSIFSEPSHCGPWLMAMGWAFILKEDTTSKEYCLALICFAEGILTFSSTALITFAVMLLVYIYKHLNKNILYIILFVTLVAAVVLISPQAQHMVESALTKLSSGSGLIRVAMTNQTHEAFFNTYGIGLGFNEITGMTLLGTMLAQVGLVGTILFIGFIVSTFRRIAQTHDGLFCEYFLLAIIFSLLISSSGLLYAKRLWFILYLLPLGGSRSLSLPSRTTLLAERRFGHGTVQHS